jgi:hypothetical protein
MKNLPGWIHSWRTSENVLPVKPFQRLGIMVESQQATPGKLTVKGVAISVNEKVPKVFDVRSRINIAATKLEC